LCASESIGAAVGIYCQTLSENPDDQLYHFLFLCRNEKGDIITISRGGIHREQERGHGMNKLIGIGCILLVSTGISFSQLATNWVDYSTTLLAGKTQSGGCCNFGTTAVKTNRLTGDIYINVIENGIWKSSDNGQTWTRIDQNKVGGRNETAWILNQDQNDPKRMANFSLDGTGAWTNDGVTWSSISNLGRGWDIGSVDWSSASPKTMIANNHESGGQVCISTNAGSTWQIASVSCDCQWGTQIAMLGAIDATTLIHSNGNGINRSTNTGGSWTQVSTTNPQTRTPTIFKGVVYLGTATGLLVSTDKGATWQTKGASVNIYQGPYFGADENIMVVAGTAGVYRSTNAGTTWIKMSDLCSKDQTGVFPLQDVKYCSSYAWDPFHNSVFATSMTHHTWKIDYSTSTSQPYTSRHASSRLAIVNSTIRSGILFYKDEVFSLAGKSLYGKRMTGAPVIVRISTEKGLIEE
jgi:hypothetical protein